MLLLGKNAAVPIENALIQKIKELKTRPPCLAVILVGDHPASAAYVKMKKKACLAVGMETSFHHFPHDVSFDAISHAIDDLNNRHEVDGILLQLPLPEHLHPYLLLSKIHPDKDVDGLHPENLGRLFTGDTTGFTPCTPLGIQLLLQHYELSPRGKHVVIVGRSQIVGKPLAALFLQNAPFGNATVTVVHSHTPHLSSITKQADILVVAMGNPHFIKKESVKEGSIVIDVGINRITDSDSPKGYRIVGDTDFVHIEPFVSAITPVPGGVGPMTISALLLNTWKSYQTFHLN